MAIAIIGAEGKLGRQVPGDVRLDHQQLDLVDAVAIRAVLDGARPEGVVLTAAYTNVDGCETNRDLAMAVNGEGPGHVARWCADNDAWILYVSTNCVFDGRKSLSLRRG